jgi:hypothetical protein
MEKGWLEGESLVRREGSNVLRLRRDWYTMIFPVYPGERRHHATEESSH